MQSPVKYGEFLWMLECYLNIGDLWRCKVALQESKMWSERRCFDNPWSSSGSQPRSCSTLTAPSHLTLRMTKSATRSCTKKLVYSAGSPKSIWISPLRRITNPFFRLPSPVGCLWLSWVWLVVQRRAVGWWVKSGFKGGLLSSNLKDAAYHDSNCR